MHRYDDKELGLSFHKDNLRFIGMIAILSLEGKCDLLARKEKSSKLYTYSNSPGDLVLLRATNLIDANGDYRPEHSVVNLRTEARVSLMLRQNRLPNERLNEFEFDNWPLE